jgi:hypothetical protein
MNVGCDSMLWSKMFQMFIDFAEIFIDGSLTKIRKKVDQKAPKN